MTTEPNQFESPASVNAALDKLAASSYYEEDHQLHWKARELLDSVPATQREHFVSVFVKRLYQDPSVANVFLAATFEARMAAPYLAQLLEDEIEVGLRARTLLYTLGQLGGEDAFYAILPYIDSSLELEAVAALARIDFPRAIPHLRRALMNDGLLQACLHAFHARRKQVGMESLKRELAILLEGDDGTLKQRVLHAFAVQDDPYNPFNSDERQEIIASFP